MKKLLLILTLFLFNSILFAQDNCFPPSPLFECISDEIQKVAATNLVQDDTLFVHRKDINNNGEDIDLVIEQVDSLSGKFQLHVNKFPPLLESVAVNSDCCNKNIVRIDALEAELSNIDTFHIVGDSLSGLGTTFQNSWFTSGSIPLRFTKDRNGTVFVEGQIRLIGSGNGGITVTQLPPTYRPSQSVSDIGYDFVSTNIAQIFITTNGAMSVDFGGIDPNLVLNFSFHP